MRVAFRNFTGGEVSPSLAARYDLQKAGSFLASCFNFIPNLHGDIERRPGTRFVASLNGPAVLLPFQFNTEPENNYVLVFMKDRIMVAQAEGLLRDVGMISPYKLEDVYKLSTAQAGDVMYLAHKDYPLRKITRSGVYPDYKWEIEEVALNNSLPAPGRPSPYFSRDNTDDKGALNYRLRYVVTAVDDKGVESLPSEVGECDGKYPTDWVVGNHVDITWQAVSGAKEYNVYRESAGYYGFIGVCDAENSTSGKLSGLRVGSEKAEIVHYGASIGQTVVIGNGHVDNEIDSQTKLSITPANNAIAFQWENLLFVRVRQWTRTVIHEPIMDPENNQLVADWETVEQNEELYYWALVDTDKIENGRVANWTRGTGTGTGTVPMAGSFGPYSVSPLYGAGATLKFVDQNYEADTSHTPKEDWDPFEGGNYPGVVAFHQQRLVLAGTKQNPASFFMSRSGDYENFRKSRPLMDDDPVEYMLASGSIDAILWAVSFGDLIIGTSGAEYKASSSGAAITPSDIQISVQSYWGSSQLFPMIIGQSIMHCQRAGSHVRDLFYSWESDGYAGNDLSLLAPQLMENSRLLQWSFQQAPGSNVWICRDDGKLLCLTYMKEQNIFGWSRHETDGKVLSVASLCGEEEDQLMLVVEREIKGEKRYFLERLGQRFTSADEIEDAFFLDCGKTVIQEAANFASGFGHLEGKEIQALCDGTPVENLLVENGRVELPFKASKISAGLNYTSAFMPMPLETDAKDGSTLGRRRAYGQCVLRLFRSIGGSYGATRPYDLFSNEAWREREFYDLPYLPENWGEAAQPFSGDIEITLPSGQDADSSIWIIQDRPLPFRLASLTVSVDFGEGG